MSAVAGRLAVSTIVRAVILIVAAAISSSSGVAQGTSSTAATGAMLAARASAAVARLSNGRVLIVGDDHGWPAELYDEASRQFMPAGAPNERRAEAAAVRLADGRVLVAGGRSEGIPRSSAELYDSASGTFTYVDSMSVARISPAAARLADGRVLIVGGHDGTHLHATAELYDPRSGEFVATGRMSAAQLGTATLLPDGRVLMIGTSSVEVYDPATESFMPTGSLAVARYGHATTLLSNGRVLVTGGVDGDHNPVADAEVYDPAAGAFRFGGRMLNPRSQHAAVALPDGAVLALGGRNASGVLRSAEVYDPATGAFSAEASLVEARMNPIVSALPDGVLIAGGIGSNVQALASAEIYRREDRRKETWTTVLSSLPSSTYGQPVTYTATVTGESGKAPSGVVQFLDGELLLGETRLDYRGRTSLTISTTPAGTRSIQAVYGGSADFKRSESRAIHQAVAKAAASGSLTVTPIQRQYSDRVTFTATVLPANAAQSVTFRMGTVVLDTVAVVQGKAVLNFALSTKTPPGSKTVTAVFNQGVQNYAIPNVFRALSIVREDARVTQYGYGTTVYTVCGTCNTATVELRARIKDISATAEANGDVSPGDIRNATFTFINRTTYGAIATVPVTLLNDNDGTVGEAVYKWTLNLGSASSKTFKIGYSVGGWYSRSTYDYVTVTVAKPR
jgi:hypothetical protein